MMTGSGWFTTHPSGTADIYKIYAENFLGEDHLRRLLEEAQTIVGSALTAPMPRPGIASGINFKGKP